MVADLEVEHYTTPRDKGESHSRHHILEMSYSTLDHRHHRHQWDTVP